MQLPSLTQLTELTTLDSLDAAALARIEHNMIEHDRAIKAFGRSNTQVTSKLMSLTLTTAGPYRRLRQCLAEADKRKQALHEASFSLRKKGAELKLKEQQLSEMTEGGPEQEYQVAMLEIEIDEIRYAIKETQRHAEGALKDIAGMQEAYVQIRDSHGIPEDWDEGDFHKGELREHVLSAFQLAFHDMMERGSLSRSVQEYLEQFGIHPFTAHVQLTDYIRGLEAMTQDRKQAPEIGHLYQFLDAAADIFGDSYKLAMRRIGLTSLITEWAQYRETLRT